MWLHPDTVTYASESLKNLYSLRSLRWFVEG